LNISLSMTKKINIRKALAGTPRPHYMVGSAEYLQEETKHLLIGNVNFTSTNEHTSIKDRTSQYLPHPHVNAGDVCFAVWNGAHIIGDILGYKVRTLINKIKIVPIKIVPPDTPLTLEVILIERERRTDKKHRSYELGSLTGRISLEGELLTEVFADYFARK